MPLRRKTLSEFFWTRVDRSEGCWHWQGKRDSNGYGLIQLHRGARRQLAHRISWQLHFGAIPNGLLVCHHCDNPPCVNPQHLFVGTQSDNLWDASRKGRLSVPGKAWEALLTHCKRGHQFTKANTYVYQRNGRSRRMCRACRAGAERSRRSKQYADC